MTSSCSPWLWVTCPDVQPPYPTPAIRADDNKVAEPWIIALVVIGLVLIVVIVIVIFILLCRYGSKYCGCCYSCCCNCQDFWTNCCCCCLNSQQPYRPRPRFISTVDDQRARDVEQVIVVEDDSTAADISPVVHKEYVRRQVSPSRVTYNGGQDYCHGQANIDTRPSYYSHTNMFPAGTRYHSASFDLNANRLSVYPSLRDL